MFCKNLNKCLGVYLIFKLFTRVLKTSKQVFDFLKIKKYIYFFVQAYGVNKFI